VAKARTALALGLALSIGLTVAPMYGDRALADTVQTIGSIDVASADSYYASPQMSPDGTIVAVPVFGERGESGYAPVVAVRLVDFGSPSRDIQVNLPPERESWSETVLVFSADGSSLLVSREDSVVVISLDTFEIASTRVLDIHVGYLGPDPGFFQYRFSPDLEWVILNSMFGLSVWSTQHGELVWQGLIGDYDSTMMFSRDGDHVLRFFAEGIERIPLGNPAPGNPAPEGNQEINLKDAAGLDIPDRFEAESDSGEWVVLGAGPSMDGYEPSRYVAANFATGAVVEIDAEVGDEVVVEFHGFSPDDSFLFFSEVNVSANYKRTFKVASLESGQTRVWDEPLLLGLESTFQLVPLPSTGQSAILAGSTVYTVEWTTPSIVGERVLLSPSNQFGGWAFLRTLADTADVALVGQSYGFDGATITFTFGRVALDSPSAFGIRATALGFTETDGIVISLSEGSFGSPPTLSVWDVVGEKRLKTFSLPFLAETEASGQSVRFNQFQLITPSGGQLMLSPDGGTVFFVRDEWVTLFDPGVGVVDVTDQAVSVWAVDVATEDYAELARFDGQQAFAVGYSQANAHLVIGMSADDNWEMPGEVVVVSVPSGEVVSQGLAPRGVQQLALSDTGRIISSDVGTLLTVSDLQTGNVTSELVASVNGSLRTYLSPDARFVAGVESRTRYDSGSGAMESLGGALYAQAIPDDSVTGRQLAGRIFEWDTPSDGVGTFSADGGHLFLVVDGEVRMFALPDFSPVDLASPRPAVLADQKSYFAAVAQPLSNTLWVGVGVNEAMVTFFPVLVEEASDSDSGASDSRGPTVFSLLLDNAAWLIPGALLLVTVAAVAFWARRRDIPTPASGEESGL